MPFNIDVKNLILILVGILNLVYGFVVYLRNRKNHTNRWFFLLVISIAAWIISIIFYRGLGDQQEVLLWARILYLSATFIPIAFLFFSITFPKEKTSLELWKKILFPVPFLAVAIVSIIPDKLILGVVLEPGQETKIIFNQFFHFLYGLYIMGYFGWTYIILGKKYLSAEGAYRLQLSFIITCTFVSTLIGVISNLILPFLGIFLLNWLGQATIIIMIIAISYAILRYRLFNIKIIATELLTFAIWIAVLIATITAPTFQRVIFDSFLLLFSIFFGVLLIRSVVKEVEQREKLEKITIELEAANERLRQLDEAKSEFLSIASHQLRTPLTSIKGLLSMLLEEFWGPLNDDQKKYVGQIMQSGERLLELIEELLDISRIEAGKIKFDFQPVDLLSLAKKITANLETLAKEKKLSLEVKEPKEILPKVKADATKISQVIENLTDNSIKYSEKGGSIIELKQQGNFIIFSIEDKGMGIPEDQLSQLFTKFQRGQMATNQHTEGAGLGLYWANKVIQAHGGEIWAESKGENKGSKFSFSLPIA